MLSDSPVSAILPSKDLAKSKEFYQTKLGLTLVPLPVEDPLTFKAGEDTTLAVYHRPEGTKAEHTVAGFMVTNLENIMSGLMANGIEFEDYDMPGFDHENKIMSYGDTKAAWFKDPDGNILALTQM